MFPILQLGPLAVQLPGLFFLLGVWVGLWLVERRAPRHGIPSETISSLVFWGLVAGILGARLGYALRFVDVYLQEPLALVSLNPSTLAPMDGAVAGGLVSLVYGRRKGLSLWPTLDALSPGLAVFSIALGLAHLSSGDAFGAPAGVPWAIGLWGARRHPSQIYEIVAAVLILGIVWRLQERRWPEGILFLSWLGLAAGGRLFLEAFRGDSVIVLDRLRLAQLLSLAVLLAAMLLMHRRAREAGLSARPGLLPGK